MTSRPSQVRVVVLTKDSKIATQVKSGGHEDTITLVKDSHALQKAMSSEDYKGVVLECNGSKHETLQVLGESIDFSKTFMLAGPLPSIDSLTQFVQWVGSGQEKSSKPARTKLSFVDYVEAQFGEFVRAMKLGSAQDLYPTFIRAVERPLIELALQETNGNQMQAARLLGVNRNTLRKKIGEFNISVEGCKSQRAKKKLLN
ncbi:MAG: hypothetical protein NPIRA02_15510 [Nitrospirales bacterium]|nr:MAG: hypothetical protein NPIRA02_15510 [Nitrospirales bacterium]